MQANDPRSPGGHERTDISVRAAMILIAGILLAIAGTMLGMRALFQHLGQREARSQPARATLVATEPDPLPPEPRLQASPVDDLRAQRELERHALEGYAWVDRAAGRVSIPIERAMELIVERGVPARPSGAR